MAGGPTVEEHGLGDAVLISTGSKGKYNSNKKEISRREPGAPAVADTLTPAPSTVGSLRPAPPPLQRTAGGGPSFLWRAGL